MPENKRADCFYGFKGQLVDRENGHYNAEKGNCLKKLPQYQDDAGNFSQTA